MESRKNTILTKEFAHFKKEKRKHPHRWYGIDIITNGDDITKWYVKITGLSEPYEDGEYLVKIEASESHPTKPPKYYFMTPNGVYELGKNACISIGSYHSDEFPSVLGMTGFIMNLIGAMLQWKTLGEGIDLLHTTANEKKRLAKNSYVYNREHHIEIISMFET